MGTVGKLQGIKQFTELVIVEAIVISKPEGVWGRNDWQNLETALWRGLFSRTVWELWFRDPLFRDLWFRITESQHYWQGQENIYPYLIFMLFFDLLL